MQFVNKDKQCDNEINAICFPKVQHKSMLFYEAKLLKKEEKKALKTELWKHMKSVELKTILKVFRCLGL